MLTRFRTASFLALMVLAASPTFAQGPGGGRGGPGGGFGGGRGGFGGGPGGGSPYSLLGNEAVQEELGLSDEQKTKSAALLGEMREARRAQFQGGGPEGRDSFRDLSPEERRERFAAMQKEAAERNAKLQAEYKTKFGAVLDEVQLQRLQQIHWQSQGVRALQDPDLANALKLSDEQKSKIAGLLNQGPGGPRGGPGAGDRGPGGPREGGFRGGSPEDREARIAEMRAQREKREAEVKAVLTDDQRAELENQLGASFDVSKLRGPGGPGGPGGERRGPGGDRGGRGGDRGGNSNI